MGELKPPSLFLQTPLMTDINTIQYISHAWNIQIKNDSRLIYEVTLMIEFI